MGIKKGREPTQTSTGLPKLSSTCVLSMASTSCEVFETLKISNWQINTSSDMVGLSYT